MYGRRWLFFRWHDIKLSCNFSLIRFYPCYCNTCFTHLYICVITHFIICIFHQCLRTICHLNILGNEIPSVCFIFYIEHRKFTQILQYSNITDCSYTTVCRPYNSCLSSLDSKPVSIIINMKHIFIFRFPAHMVRTIKRRQCIVRYIASSLFYLYIFTFHS